MACNDGDLLESKIFDAANLARRQGQLDVALSLALTRELLLRDRFAPHQRNVWAIDATGLVDGATGRATRG